MRDASGRNRLRYADTLRAIGHYLDSSTFRDVTLVETPEGFGVVGASMTTSVRGFDVTSPSISLRHAIRVCRRGAMCQR